jgi:hypoxanthine phosphoribosyltransferase
MSQVKILDKEFELFIGFEKIHQAIEKIAHSINEDFSGSNPLFLCVLNGSFMFASDLLKMFDGPCEISFIKLSSYRGITSSEEVKTLIGLDHDISGRDVIVLEDIVDTGITMTHLVEDLKKLSPRSLKIATLLLKPEALRTSIRPDYIGLEIPNDFIVGYGLDYNGYGRNLKDIYKIIN